MICCSVLEVLSFSQSGLMNHLNLLVNCMFVFFSPAARIGRQLAMIGDDINDRYSPQFNQMIRTLNITPDTAYEAFAGVARK